MIKFKPATNTTRNNGAAYIAEMRTVLRLCGVDTDASTSHWSSDNRSAAFTFVRGNLQYRLRTIPARGHNTVVEVISVATEVSPGEWSFTSADAEARPTKTTATGRSSVNASAIVESWMCALPCSLSVIRAAEVLAAFMDRMEAERVEEIETVCAAARRLHGNKLEIKSIAGSLGLTLVYAWGNTYRTPFERLTIVMEEESGTVNSATVALNLPAKAVFDLLPALAELVEAAARTAESQPDGASDAGV